MLLKKLLLSLLLLSGLFSHRLLIESGSSIRLIRCFFFLKDLWISLYLKVINHHPHNLYKRHNFQVYGPNF
ncbi:Uncharacterized protein TCM_007994 [Theobroma cacao]|uniref:Secreted protein n=1 Tax=Theobroma cacao TaxID=3641 RepID=A0A061E2U5_THECC|nr:Uncharacterized protein TCM_007994 [Theobroma cacao]